MPELHTESVGLHFRPAETKNYVNNELQIGEELTLKREPSNAYDPNAIQVHAGEFFIGFVPKTSNAVLASLMDQEATPNLRAHVFSFVGKNPQILIEWDSE